MSTWGQLRLILQGSFPGVSLDLLDSAIRTRYTTVLSATDWIGLKAHATIQTLAAYQSVSPETVTLTVGSAGVAGTGTAWTAAVVGQRFYRPGDNVVYTVAGFVAPTQITLDRPYEGVSGNAPGTVYSGTQYVLMQDVYPLPANAKDPVTILNPSTGHPMGEFTHAGLDVSRGTRATVGDPYSFSLYDDTPETSPSTPVFHQVQFYPPPRYARGFEMEYARDPNVFTGENTGDSPLPFVTDRVLLEGARADIATGQKEFAQSAKYEFNFNDELKRMLQVEHAERRKKTSFHMAARYTRHRFDRVDRSYGRGWGPGRGGPNQMNLGAMAAIVSQRLNEGATPTYYPKPEIVAGLNEAQRFFALRTLCVERTAPWTVAAGATHMLGVFPDWLAPLRLQDATGAKIRPASFSDLWSLDSQWPSVPGAPKRYVHAGGDLVLLYPASAVMLTWHYAAAPAAIVNDTDVSEVPAQFHEVLVKYALYRMRMVEGGAPFASALSLFAEFMDAANTYAEYIRARNIGAGYDSTPPELALFDKSRLKARAARSK